MMVGRTSEELLRTPGVDLAELTRQRPVLLSDDCLELMLVTKLILEHRLGLPVVAPPAPYLTLRLVQTQPISLLISDVSKPGMDGLSMLAALREDPAGRTLPVLFVSAYVGGVDRAHELGAAVICSSRSSPRNWPVWWRAILSRRAGTFPATPGLPAQFDPEFLADWRPCLIRASKPIRLLPRPGWVLEVRRTAAVPGVRR
jgi:CheY-like chemotaxis protein